MVGARRGRAGRRRSARAAGVLDLTSVDGTMFLLSALANRAVPRTGPNVLAVESNNVVFSAVAGLVLLLLGTYRRLSGRPTRRWSSTSPRAGGVAGWRPWLRSAAGVTAAASVRGTRNCATRYEELRS